MSLRTRLRPSRLLRAGVSLAVVAPAFALTAVPGPGAAAADPTYLPAERAIASTVTFSYIGAEQLFVVPDGIHELEVVAVGAPGGAVGAVDPTTGGGRAARVTAELSVEPGDRLHVRVGGGGFAGGAGWNGGGQPVASSTATASGGGGATDVRTCGQSDTGCSALASRLVVAAGGGGAGLTADGTTNVDLAGGDAGASAPDYAGVRGTSGGGRAASETAGGAGGVDSSYVNPGRGNGNAGTYGAGGAARYVGAPFRGGGGGGGGVYGGGGGGTGQYYGAGGGGGSSLVPDGGTISLADRTVASGVTISYDAGPVTQVAVGVADATLVSTGEDSTTVTATATLADGTKVPALEVLFDSTDPAQSVGPVTDHGDGTYSATLTGSTTVGAATVTATARGSLRVHDVSGTTSVTTEGYELRVAPVTDLLVGTGTDEVTVRATAMTAGDVGLDALDVSFTSTDPTHAFGAVTDHGDGTYSVTLTGSTTVGSATIGASSAGATSYGAEVTTEGYAVTVQPVLTSLVATGDDSVPVTATARSTSGRLLTDLDVSFTSTDAGQSFAAVVDRGDGTYTTTLSGSTTPGSATVEPAVADAGAPTLVGTDVTTDGYEVRVRAIDPILGTGAATTEVLAVARRLGSTEPSLPGLTVSFASTDPSHLFGPVTDHGDGTYSATLTGSATPGVASIHAVVTGAGTPSTPAVELVTDPYARPALSAALGSSGPARGGWFRTPVTVTFVCTGTLPLTTACPVPVELAADGRNQVVTRSVTDTLGSVGSVTTPGVNIDRTAPKVAVRGARSGATYPKVRRLACRASDALSGVESCKVVTTKRKSRKRTVVTWQATAVDRAGNTTTTRGKYTIRAKKRR
ncbi:invasin domain 3-containing protein [Nocardioides sp. W7]|uniref:invasin domain 3-containing protein n=1 Tax=Nocardioides sp. W7 TaxID=2931390 RepID=UPI001FD56EBE|nr:invasin domain 3-containing protein [Nocardioides sp. W7]